MARPKKVVESTDEPKGEVANLSPVETALDNAKGMFESLIVVGVKSDGNVDLVASHPSFPHMQTMLQDAQFELFLYKKGQLNQKKENI